MYSQLELTGFSSLYRLEIHIVVYLASMNYEKAKLQDHTYCACLKIHIDILPT